MTLCDPIRSLTLPYSNGQSQVAVTGRRNFHQQGENDPPARPEPAYEFDQRIAW